MNFKILITLIFSLQGYLEKVRQEKSLFTAADAETILGNIEELYHFHKEFLKELQQAIKFDRMEESIVGHLFIKHVSRLLANWTIS